MRGRIANGVPERVLGELSEEDLALLRVLDEMGIGVLWMEEEGATLVPSVGQSTSSGGSGAMPSVSGRTGSGSNE